MRDTSPSYYKKMWDTLALLSKHKKEINAVCAKVRSGQGQYSVVESVTKVPWYVVGIIHQMECSGDWSRNIANGQPWNKVTTITPAGRGPFESWRDAAIDAMTLLSDVFPSIWTVESISKYFENYNGMGYAKHNVNSPYLYSFSNNGVGVGKYVGEKPGVPAHYDSNAVSDQCGAITILYRLVSDKICSVPYSNDIEDIKIIYNPKNVNEEAKKYQKFLNDSFGFKLAVDGKCGIKTSDAHKKVFGQFLFGDKRSV